MSFTSWLTSEIENMAMLALVIVYCVLFGLFSLITRRRGLTVDSSLNE